MNSKIEKLKGVFTALVTPFDGGKVDFASLEKLVDFQIKNGVDGFVVNGTTAESPTLSKTEVEQIYTAIRKQVGASVPLILGTGSNSTDATIENTKFAQKLAADASLVVVPYYNKPPQRGLAAHFKAVAAAASELPLILYNVPGRTITALEAGTIQELSKVSNIVGIKEASGNIDFDKQIAKDCGSEFVMLSGDDGTYAAFLAAGGHGVISVATHIMPKQFKDWTVSARSGNSALGLKEIEKYKRMIDLLFIEANPIPVKMALHKMGILKSPELRLPMMTLTPQHTETLVAEMKVVGLL